MQKTQPLIPAVLLLSFLTGPVTPHSDMAIVYKSASVLNHLLLLHNHCALKLHLSCSRFESLLETSPLRNTHDGQYSQAFIITIFCLGLEPCADFCFIVIFSA